MKSFLKKYKYWVLALFLGVIFFNVMSYLAKKRKEEMIHTFKSGVYSIGQITDFKTETRSDYYRYSFYFKNKLYKSRCHCGGGSSSLTIGQNYFLVLNPEKPIDNNFLLYSLPVPDSITEAPPEGWKELPIPVDKEEIRNFLENY